ncbi:MAG TPA: ABC transporter substrate-binding protein [Gallionellaceae bacterium]|nr:ABC transporter substrate-binding protein [Gallionellaceae bacterium]
MKKLLQRVLDFALAGLIFVFMINQSHESFPLPIINSAFGAENPPVVIAHVAPTSGRFALHAEADRRGAEMAIEEFNARGGVLGREIVLVSRDPTLDANRAAQVAEELITQTKVGFMVGAISSDVAASMSAVCQKYGVIFINTNSSSPSESVENAHRTKFVFDANGANFNRALIKYALANRKLKRVLLLTEDNGWGHSNAAASRPYIIEYGGRIVGEVIASEALPDPAAVLRQVAAVPADVVVTSISGDNQIKIFSQIKPGILEMQSWVVGEVDWEELYPAPGTPRPLFGTTWAWHLDTPGTAEFVARYRKRYGHTKLAYPGDVTHAAYLATKALLAAIERVGTTDNHAVIQQLEKYNSTATERMQNAAAYMDPVSHHLQQSIYIARWNPRADRPEHGLEILAHISPKQVQYEQERTTRLESLADTPHYAP